MRFLITAIVVSLLFSCSLSGNESVLGVNQAEASIMITDVGGWWDKPDIEIFHITGDDAQSSEFIRNTWNRYRKIFPASEWSSFGPDAGYREITMVFQGKNLVLQSWHPIFEKDPSLVVTSMGVESLDDRDRATVLNNDDQEFVKLRNTFDQIYQACVEFENKHKE